MPFSETFTLGLGLLILGSVLLALVVGLIRWASSQPHSASASAVPRVKAMEPMLNLSSDPPRPREAVLVIQPGGKLGQLNETARQWFQTGEDHPNLERMAQHTYPPDEFLGLCARAGQAQFTLDGHLVLGTSYELSHADQPAVLVSLRQAQALFLDGAENSAEQIQLLAEFAHRINANLELEPTLHAILECVEQSIPADLTEISLWEADSQRLTTYRFFGLPGVDRRLEKVSPYTWFKAGFSNQLVANHQAVWVNDLQANHEIPTVPAGEMVNFRSYLGAPVLDGDVLLGTLELTALKPHSFQAGHRDILILLAGLASQAIKNARRFEAEHTQAANLTGLTDLTLALQDVSDPEFLFSSLTESVYALLNVEIMGFLLYDEGRRLLYGQNPFHGLPPNVVDWCRMVIPPSSEAESILMGAELIHSNQPDQDPRLKMLGLQSIAQAAAIRHTILAPLASAGRVVGYLQAANPHSGLAFDEAEIRRLVQIAAQVAPIIDNAFLVRDARRRAQRSETLRRIASLTGSTATLDEMLKYSMLDLARLLQADAGAILLLDPERGELHPHWASLYGIDPERLPQLSHLSIEDVEFTRTVTGSRHALLSGSLEQETLISLYHSLVGEMDLHSAIIVPLISRERGIGELLIASRQTDFYDYNDERSVLTAAGQLAAAIEQTVLYSQTDQDLRQRVDQLTALTRISRDLNSTLDLSYLLQRVYDEALTTTGADCGTILLYELDADHQGDEPHLLHHLGDAPLAQWGEQEKWVLLHNESLLVEDYDQLVEQRQGFQTGPEHIVQPPHPGVKSSLLAPIGYQGQVAGLIWLHSGSSYAFDSSARQITEALAIQAAIALGNAHRYQELFRRSELLDRRVEAFARLLEISRELRTSDSLEDTLEAIAYAIQASTPFDMVLVSVMDSATGQLQRVTGAGIPIKYAVRITQSPATLAGDTGSAKAGISPGQRLFHPLRANARLAG